MVISHFSKYLDLISPDGFIKSIQKVNDRSVSIDLVIKDIPANFLGYQVPKDLVLFNLKSTLAQIGLQSETKEIILDSPNQSAYIHLNLISFSSLATKFLSFLKPGAYLGKLFIADDRRLIKKVDHIVKMQNHPHGFKIPSSATLELKENIATIFIPLSGGEVSYLDSMHQFINCMSLALHHPHLKIRDWLKIQQIRQKKNQYLLEKDQILLLTAEPLTIKECFGKVAEQYLPEKVFHTSAFLIDPFTHLSGDIYEFFGTSSSSIDNVPLQFYHVESFRQSVSFTDSSMDHHFFADYAKISDIFQTCPYKEKRCALFCYDSPESLSDLSKNWIPTQESSPEAFICKLIQENIILKTGSLFLTESPSRETLHLLTHPHISKVIKNICFYSRNNFFSSEERSLLLDLHKKGMNIYSLDTDLKDVLSYVYREDKKVSIFSPIKEAESFKKATLFGLYGSNLNMGSFENEIFKLFQNLIELQKTSDHPLFNAKHQLAIVTGGGPGVMQMGNQIAIKLGLLSCAHALDFSNPLINEQQQNKYAKHKMTYQTQEIWERQRAFQLDFPIFTKGGIGTDFELSLEELNIKICRSHFVPIILFGEYSYWREKISHKFQLNLKEGTIKGNEWISNCYYCVENAEEALSIYKSFFEGRLKIGPSGPIFSEGFYYQKPQEVPSST